MKATLTFKLPKDKANFKLYIKAEDMSLAIWDIYRELCDRRHRQEYVETAISNAELLQELIIDLVDILESRNLGELLL